METPKTLDLILPCFNPREGWQQTLSISLDKIKSMLPANVLNTIIVVNDGSNPELKNKDIEQLISAHSDVKLLEYGTNKGKGFAVRYGVKSSEADIQIYTDIDVPYVEESIAEFYKLLSSDLADIVLASRGESYYSSLSPFRKILSKSLRWLNGLLFGLSIKDTQGGLKGFNATGRNVFLKTTVNRYLFDLEFIQKASQQNLRLKAIDVLLKPDIILPTPSPTILLKELNNLVRLLLNR